MIFFILISIFSIYLTYHQVYTPSSIGHKGFRWFASDTQQHIQFITDYIYHGRYIPHPLWHLLVFYTSKIFHISLNTAAVCISSASIILWVYSVYYIVKHMCAKFNIYIQMLIVLSIIVIGPLCIPWYQKVIYYGQGAPNVWHNVTYWMVKPFALMSVYFLIYAQKNNKTKYLLFAFSSAVISIFAKPSFIIVFIPAIILYIFIKNIYNKKFIQFVILLSITSFIILLYQYTLSFGKGTDSKVVFDFLGVWSLFSKNIPISIFLALAFPIMLIVFSPKTIQNEYVFFSWILTILGIIYFAFLAQAGKYYTDGNFGWSYAIGMNILYTFSIILFFKEFHEIEFKRRYFLLILFLAQIFIGIYYLEKILIGQNPVFIGLYL